MQDGKVTGYTKGSIEYIQILALRAGFVLALFVGLNAWLVKAPSWQWVAGLTAVYAVGDFALSCRHVLPGITELLFKLVLCAGLTCLQAEYSSVLYHLLLLRIALRVGKRRTGRVALVIGAVYLAAALAVTKALAVQAVMQLAYNVVSLALLSYAVIYVDTLITKQMQDDRQMLELIKQNDRNYQMALTDALTGLLNHRAYKEKIDGLPQYVLLMIDIDHFKKFNDTFGHLVGDKVLITIGNIIKLSVRSGDLAFRYGGEEFVVVLPGTTAQIGLKIAERLREKVATWSFDQGVPVTVSIGLAVKKPGMNSQTVFEQADTALYTAKQSGRNNVQSFSRREDGQIRHVN